MSKDKIGMKGTFKFEHRDGAGNLLDTWEETNIVTNEGLNHILNTEFAGAPQIGAWYISLYKNNYVPIATDKASSFGASAGECSTIGQNRQQFTVAVTNQIAGNTAAPATFTFTGNDTVTGAYLISSQAVGSGQGVLFSALPFLTPRPVVSGDQLTVTYTVQAVSA